MTSLYVNEHSRFMTCAGAHVHYRDEGNASGPPIVLIHGILSSLHTWDGWVRVLGGHFRILRLDLPGFGLTGPWLEDRPYDLNGLVQFLRGFLDALRIEKCILAGHSLGGWLSWEFACAYPHRVERLVLVSPAGFDLDRPPFVVRFARLPFLPGLLARLLTRFLVGWVVKSAFGNSRAVTGQTVLRYRELFAREENRKAFFEMVRAPLVASTGRLESLRMPTLIQWGERDRWIPVRNAYRFSESILGAIVKTYSGAGHLLAEEYPDETARDALSFLI